MADGAPGDPAPAFVAAFTALLALHLVATGHGWDVVRLATKPLLMPVLAGWVLSWRGPRLLVAALLCGWGGDVLLEIGGTGAFLAGMGCFAAGHVCYLRIFLPRGAFAGPRTAVRVRCAVYAAVWAVMVALLWPGLPAGMRVPVAAYSLLLVSMAAGRLRARPAHRRRRRAVPALRQPHRDRARALAAAARPGRVDHAHLRPRPVAAGVRPAGRGRPGQRELRSPRSGPSRRGSAALSGRSRSRPSAGAPASAVRPAGCGAAPAPGRAA